jgi:carbon-monoxide dehydrogenase medium subunit
MIPAAFEYTAPKTLAEAFRLMKKYPKAKIMAGGQSLLSLMKLRAASPPMVIDLGRIPALSYIKRKGTALVIGAMTTHQQIASSALVRKEASALAHAADAIGDIQVRNRGTIGGSLAHADPAADYPAAILALDAVIVAKAGAKTRQIASDRFFTGVFANALRRGELITEIQVPLRPAITGASYLKMKHPASGFAVVGAAVVLRRSEGRGERTGGSGGAGQVRVAFTGATARAFRAKGVEAALQGKTLDDATVRAAMEHAPDGQDMLEDLVADAAYRANLVRVYGRRAVLAATK